MRSVTTTLVIGALALTAASCGDVVRDGRSPMFLVIDGMAGQAGGKDEEFGNPLLSDVDPVFNDLGEAILRIEPKDIVGTVGNPTEPSSNNSVTITRYHVTYTRADGRNTPGVDVPHAFDGAVTGTVVYGTPTTIVFNLVRHAAKLESPLVQLVSNLTVVSTIAEVTFYGRDLVGNEIAATGYIGVEFANFADSD